MITRRRAFFSAIGCVAAATILLASTATSSAASGPESPDPGPAFLYSFTVNQDADPPGANDWNCQPSAAHPYPVVLVHGTWENRYDNFAAMSPAIKRAGYCVYALDYGDGDTSVLGAHPAVKGTGDITVSAKELGTFVNKVLAATGKSKVDIVGHSQGGMMPRQYMKFEGGAGKVHNLITLGATHHGTTLSGIATLAETIGLLGQSPILIGKAGEQQAVGSPFLANLNAGGDTVSGVNYVVIGSTQDEVTTPYQTTFLTAGPGATVKNITLQDGCAVDLSRHVQLAYSQRAIGIVLQELGTPPFLGLLPCLPVLPLY
jgi:triacylglycerol esterase/lipase EstA (alpha/beta hydrolase family)